MYSVIGFIGIVLGVWAFIRTTRHEREFRALKDELAVLTDELQSLAQRRSHGSATPAPTEDATPVIPDQEMAPEQTATVQSVPSTTEPIEDDDAMSAEPAGAGDGEAPPPPPAGPPPTSEPAETLEQALTSRWMVWLGGITIALGGAFLVRYSLDQGWLGPTARIVLGLILGIVLVVAGEWLRQRPLQQEIARIRPNYVPPALSASGVSIAFASTFAAYNLYGLIGPMTSFILLSAISVGAIGLSLLQGPFIAALGLAGSFLVPVLVASDDPSALGFFSYIYVVVLACFVVTRYRDWAWLSIAAIVGVFLWTSLWLGSIYVVEQGHIVGIFLAALLASAYALAHQMPVRNVPAEPSADGANALNMIGVVHLAWTAFALIAVLTFVFLHEDDFGTASLGALAAIVLITVGACRYPPLSETLAGGAALLTVMAVSSWGLAQDAPAPPEVLNDVFQRLPIAPATIMPYLWANGIAALFWSAVGYWFSRQSERPLLWAACSVLVPILLLVFSYLRLQDFQENVSWGVLAMALAAMATLTVLSMAKPNQPVTDQRAAFYAVGAIAAISLAFAMTLERAFLTVALAVQLPAIAWVYLRFPIQALRWTATVIAGIVLVRLALNPFIVDYEIGGYGIFNWVLYGYGVPAASFALAYHWFRDKANTLPQPLLESGTIIFIILLISFEIRVLLEGRIDSTDYTLFEASLQTLNWLTASFVLYWQAARAPNQVRLIGSRILLALAIGHIALFHYLDLNPILSAQHIWGVVLINLLLFAYGLPALVSGLYAWLAHRLQDQVTARITGVATLILIFTQVSLEVRRLFRGTDLSSGVMLDAESYGYSLAWLVLAGILVGLAIWRQVAVLRYASLAVTSVAILKVFLFDAAMLPGIWRALSFLGLGLSLIGLGYLYQRYVFPPSKPETKQHIAQT